MLVATDMRTPTWDCIDENFWEDYLPSDFYSQDYRTIRVRKGSQYYNGTVILRYEGLAEAGYINHSKSRLNEMMLERDDDSIILAMINNRKVLATLTLNTPTKRFPELAATLEKGVECNYRYFNHEQSLEFAKMAFDKPARSLRYGINLFMIACIVSKFLHKQHFWNVSRVHDGAMSFIAKFGFHFSPDLIFFDKSLSDTKSCLGYCSLNSIPHNANVPSYIRKAVAGILAL